MDIGTEELSHLEVIGTLARMHLKPSKKSRDAAEADPLIAICGGGGVDLHNSQGNAWTADYLKITGELDVDLRSNIAAEARAKIVYERLINFTQDQGSIDALQFLMTREITHMKAFMAALDSLVTDPFAVGNIPPSENVVNLYLNDSTGEGDEGQDYTGPWNTGEGIEIVEAPAFQALRQSSPRLIFAAAHVPGRLRAPRRPFIPFEKRDAHLKMKAVVWHGVGDIRLDDVPEPKIQDPTDAIVRLTASAICGTDLHFIRGTCRAWCRARSSAMRASASSRRSARTSATSTSATASSSAPPSPAGSAPTAARATTPSATRPTPTARRPARPSSAARRTPARSRAAGRIRPHPVRQRRPGQAARRGHRRPGHPALRHLPHGLLRRGHRRDQARPHRRRLRLRPRRPVRHRQRQADGRRPRLRRGRRPLTAGDGARRRAPRSSTSTRKTPSRPCSSSPAASAWTAPSTPSAWTPTTPTPARPARRPRRRRASSRSR